ncbi:MAG: osmoprotectant transport system substrate-binding protein opuBD [Thermoleophilaceae bacterium]|nr:osmoprotectant transport system substrate-binding protein opuBD [Thermoleophilaceae bacterium]
MTMLAAITSDFSDAIKFIFQERQSVAGGVEIGGSHLLPLLWKHLQVTFEAIVIASVVALPIALWLGHLGKGQIAASTASNVGRAVPSFAVLVFMSTYLGLNVTNLVFAMVLLAIPPIFTNTYVGVRQVDPDAVDAARGMGMTGAEIVRRVELPMSLPLIFGGIRTSVVNVIATATLGPFVGVATLGEPIINANVYGDAGRLGGAILVAALAIGAEFFFAGLQRAVTPKGLRADRPSRRSLLPGGSVHSRTRPALPVLLLAALASLMFALAACGDNNNDSSSTGSASSSTGSDSGKLIQKNADNASKPTITMGSKNFTEEYILGEIYAQALQAAGYKVKKQLNLGSEQIAIKAVKSGKVDAYPEYTGTALTSFYKVKPADVPKDAQAAYDQVKADAAKEQVTAFPPTPFTDSNGFAMTQAGADKIGGATKLSDLSGKASSLTLAGPPECAQREDCKLGLEKVYGLKFKKFTSIDLAKRHEVLKNGQADVSLVFTTDGQIKADKLVLLQDDKQLFPPYNVSVLARTSTVDKAGPDMGKVIEQVQGGLTTQVMQELNSRVDLDKEKPAAVAKEYLTESGYIK